MEEDPKTQVETNRDKKWELATKYLGPDVVALITEETTKDFIQWRKARGGKMVPYVASYDFTRKFNQVFGFLWDLDVTEAFRDEKAQQIVAKVRVTVKLPGQTITRTHPDGTVDVIRIDPVEIGKTQFGGSDIKKAKEGGSVIDLADDYKAAVSDGKKKCGSEFGFFLDVYSMGGESNEADSKASSENLRLVKKWGTEAGMSEDKIKEFCTKEVGITFEELDNTTALVAINKLRAKAKESAG